ncbi:MAG: AI-2E family transporter [Ruminococcaceae bacterium]|nr:AI-2E family transporter [Oscillospiraceae bacterium]
MKHKKHAPYIAAGVTAFLVVAAAILFCFALLRIDVIAGFCSSLAYILRPITFGLVLAFLLLPLHRNIFAILAQIGNGTLCKSKRGQRLTGFAAILLSLLILFLLLYLLLAMVIPQVYISVVGLIQSMPGYIRSAQVWLQEFLKSNPDVRDVLLPVYDSVANSLQEWLQSDLLPNLESANSTLHWLETQFWPSFSSVATGVSSLLLTVLYFLKDSLIGVIVSVYLLTRKDTFAAQAKKITYSIFRPRFADVIVEETRNAYRILSGFIIGKLIDSLIIGILCLICCNIFGFPYPVLIATVVGVTNIIPFFGPFIGAIPCILLILLVNPLQSVYFALFILVLQQFDGNILGPKILGDSTGLDAFWVLFSILLFGGLFGFTGMVIGVPVFAMIYSILNRIVRNGLSRRGLPLETEEYIGKTAPMAPRSTFPDDDWDDK